MTGLFYSTRERAFYRVRSRPNPRWIFISHDTNAHPNHCRRILREALDPAELRAVDWSGLGNVPESASAV